MLKQNPLISIIVPVYNVESLLPRCIESILAQNYDNLEIFLVDDGSRDDSGRICDEYAAKDSRIRVIHKENGGQSSARNLALDAMTGEYVTFVDSDDWLEPDVYTPMMDLMLEKQVKLVCAGRYDVKARTGEKKLGLCPKQTEVIGAEEMLGRLFTWDNCDSAPWDKLYHRSLFDSVRFPSRSNFEDVAVVYKLVEAAGTVAMLSKPIYNYYHRAGSTSQSGLTERTFYFEEYTQEILTHIQKEYPAIGNQALYFHVRALTNSVLCVDLAGGENRKRFMERGRQSRRQLFKLTASVLKLSVFSWREKRLHLLLITGLFRPIMKLRKKVA